MNATKLFGLAVLLVSAGSALAQAPRAAGTPSATTGPQSADVQARVEARIKSLHDRLHITAAEEQNWQAFTAVMRQNAQQESDALAARQKAFGSMNAVQDMQSYADITAQQAQQISRLVGPFQTLYAQFSADQKETADTIFHNYTTRAGARPRG